MNEQKGILHITIGASPQTSRKGQQINLGLENDLRMIKAALLYADRATLCSPVSAAIIDVLSLVDLPKSKKLELLELFPSLIPDDPLAPVMTEVMKMYKRVRSKRYSKKGRLETQKWESALTDNWSEVMDGYERLLLEAGGDGIIRARNSALLDVYTFDSAIERMSQESKQRGIVEEYIGVVGASVSDGSTYPLFDQDTAEIIREGIKAGVIPISEPAIARGKETGLAAEVLERLPLFDDASVDEILDIREELKKHLIRFRSAMLDFSDKIKNASWDKDFSFDAERVFRRDISPAVLDIEDEVKSNRYMMELVRKFLDKPLALTSGSALALAVSNLTLPAIAVLSVGAAFSFTTALYDTDKAWREKNLKIEQNSMFFYYKAGKLLAE
jgi:hypothetical protein